MLETEIANGDSTWQIYVYILLKHHSYHNGTGQGGRVVRSEAKAWGSIPARCFLTRTIINLCVYTKQCHERDSIPAAFAWRCLIVCSELPSWWVGSIFLLFKHTFVRLNLRLLGLTLANTLCLFFLISGMVHEKHRWTFRNLVYLGDGHTVSL